VDGEFVAKFGGGSIKRAMVLNFYHIQKIVEWQAELGYNAFDCLFSLLEEWSVNFATFKNR